MDQRLLLESPSRGLLVLGRELESACSYLERDPISPSHVRAAEAILAATLDDIRESLAQLDRIGLSPADDKARRGFAALAADLEAALELLLLPSPSFEKLRRAGRVTAAVASLLYWSATELQIRTLPETDDPLV